MEKLKKVEKEMLRAFNVSRVYRERKKKSCASGIQLCGIAVATAAGWKKKKKLIVYFNDQKWAYISGLLKFWGPQAIA